MENAAIIIIGIILLVGLLYFEKKDSVKGILPTKTLLSCLFIVVALIQPHPIPGYYTFILIGLIFCLGGDVLLALPQERAFFLGLVSFLLGHVFYVVGFMSVAQINIMTWVGTPITLILSGAIYWRLLPNLGDMKIPVLVYVIVITVMVVCACSVFGVSNLNLGGMYLVLVGAVSFYFSDVFVARDRFLKNEFLNRLIGLPMYYFGQFLIAFSVGFLK